MKFLRPFFLGFTVLCALYFVSSSAWMPDFGGYWKKIQGWARTHQKPLGVGAGLGTTAGALAYWAYITKDPNWKAAAALASVAVPLAGGTYWWWQRRPPQPPAPAPSSVQHRKEQGREEDSSKVKKIQKDREDEFKEAKIPDVRFCDYLPALLKKHNVDLGEGHSEFNHAQKMYYIKQSYSDHIKEEVFRSIVIKHKSLDGPAPSDDEKKSFSEYYKIHLMPTKEDFVPVILTVAELLKNNDPPFGNISVAKIYCDYIYASLDPKIDSRNRVAGIILYVYRDAKTVQKVLNALVDKLSIFKGSGLLPRYNAQVNDLVYIAQGGAGDKKNILDEDKEKDNPFLLYELPHLIYYDSQNAGDNNKNYHLKYPDTDTEITQPYREGHRRPEGSSSGADKEIEEEFCDDKSDSNCVIWSKYAEEHPSFSEAKKSLEKNWVDNLDTTGSSENIRALLKSNDLPTEEAYYDFDQKAFYLKNSKVNIPLSLSDFKRETLGKAVDQIDESVKSRLSNNYKIHLMPKTEEFIPVIIKVSELIKNNPLLVDSAKVYSEYINNTKWLSKFSEKMISSFKEPIKPGIAISVNKNKVEAQKILSFLFNELKEFDGVGLRPQFNAQVNNLIYISQGDDADKKKKLIRGTGSLFENNKIYYDPNKIGEKGKNYHLTYPGTEEIEIIKPERPEDTFPGYDGKGKGKA